MGSALFFAPLYVTLQYLDTDSIHVFTWNKWNPSVDFSDNFLAQLVSNVVFVTEQIQFFKQVPNNTY
jgi:hypothetical protein